MSPRGLQRSVFFENQVIPILLHLAETEIRQIKGIKDDSQAPIFLKHPAPRSHTNTYRLCTGILSTPFFLAGHHL
jgi:hypothetical protein